MAKCCDSDSYIDGGFRVFGPTTMGGMHCWYFPTEELAKTFAEHQARETGENVIICEYIGRFRPVKSPVEWIAKR